MAFTVCLQDTNKTTGNEIQKDKAEKDFPALVNLLIIAAPVAAHVIAVCNLDASDSNVVRLRLELSTDSNRLFG